MREYTLKKQLQQVQQFHEKFRVLISPKPSLIPQNRSSNRYRLMQEEVEEYRKGAEKKDLENIAKELANILYVVYGTIVEHGLQDQMEAIFAEVHRSNMSKEFHQYKMVKGPSFSPAAVGKL